MGMQLKPYLSIEKILSHRLQDEDQAHIKLWPERSSQSSQAIAIMLKLNDCC